VIVINKLISVVMVLKGNMNQCVCDIHSGFKYCVVWCLVTRMQEKTSNKVCENIAKFDYLGTTLKFRS
jgi:hypothetical protein